MNLTQSNGPPIPSPTASVLALLCALSNPSNDVVYHQKALTARDEALSSSPESYSNLCLQFTYVMSTPSIELITATEMETFKQMDSPSYMQLSHDPSLWNTQFRIMAGLLLKNSLVRPPIYQGQGCRMKLTPMASEEIKQLLLRCIIDETNQGVRNAASSCVAVCSVPLPNLSMSHATFPLEQWPALIPFLLQCCSKPTEQVPATSVAWGALSTLKKLLEDNITSPILLQSEHIVPTLIGILQSPIYIDPNSNPKMLQLSLQCLHTLVEPLPTAMVLHMEKYLQILSSLSNHPSNIVQAHVCKTISTLLAIRTEYVQPHIVSISEFLLTSLSKSTSENHSSDSGDETVALESAEFWLQYSTLDEESLTPLMQTTLIDIYPRLLPALLNCIVYSEDKIQDILIENEEMLQEQQNNSIQGSKNQAPIFHRSKAASKSFGLAKNDNRDEDDESDGTNPNVDDDDDDSSWTLRKCAAATLDSLSALLPAATTLLPLLPLLQSGLSNQENPWVREASILALGAIAAGCHDEMSQNYLPQLHPFLIQQIEQESLPQIRCIACWTLSRYSDWTLSNAQVFQQTCSSILNLVKTDKNSKVRYAACSAFGTFVESSCSGYEDYENPRDEQSVLIPLLKPIYQHLISGLEIATLQGDSKGIMVIFDTIGIMADYLGEDIGYNDLPSIYIPPLLQIWTMAASSGNLLEKNLLPLMEAMASISLVIGQNFQPWALHIFEKCMQTIEVCIMSQAANVEEKDDIGDEDYDPMICATDCLDGMVEGLMSSFDSLVQSSEKYGHHFLGMLQNLTKSNSPGVRMSSFALLGDLARRSPNVLKNGISILLKEALTCCSNTQHPSVCNNATWAIGEICLLCSAQPQALNGLIDQTVEKLGRLLMAESYANGSNIEGLAQNAAASMGRLARVDHTAVGRYLGEFFIPWCNGLASVSDQGERCDGFTGLILAIQSNPSAIICPPNPIDPEKLTSLIFATISWHIPRDEEGQAAYTPELANGPYAFETFPEECSEVGLKLGELLRSIKCSVSPDDWNRVERLPTNIRRLLTESYQV